MAVYKPPTVVVPTAHRLKDPEILSPALDALTVKELKRDKACRQLQRFFRNISARRHGSAMLALWPSLDKLRGLYVDEAAAAAGAKKSALYTDEMLVKREALKSNPLVTASLDLAWEACAHGLARLDKKGSAQPLSTRAHHRVTTESPSVPVGVVGYPRRPAGDQRSRDASSGTSR